MIFLEFEYVDFYNLIINVINFLDMNYVEVYKCLNLELQFIYHLNSSMFLMDMLFILVMGGVST
jgi:hypothetical protein